MTDRPGRGGGELDWVYALRSLVEAWLGGGASRPPAQGIEEVKRRALEEIREVFLKEREALVQSGKPTPEAKATLGAFRAVLEVIDREIGQLDPEPEGGPPPLRKVAIEE